jgi:hypothetical protein
LADAALKVLWNRGLALRRIGIIESSVSLRGLILSEACPLHAAFDDQPPSALPVDRRPSAARSPRREALQEEVLTMAAKLPVDPPEADRLVDRFRLRNGGLQGALLGDLSAVATAISKPIFRPDHLIRSMVDPTVPGIKLTESRASARLPRRQRTRLNSAPPLTCRGLFR